MGLRRLWPAALAILASAVALLPLSVGAQSMSRVAATLAAIEHYPLFYHDKAVTIVATTVETAGAALTGIAVDPPKQFIIVPQSGRVPSRQLELRGRLFDIGRFTSDDSRLGPLDLPRVITTAMGDRWPARGQLLILHGATWSERDAQPAATMRNLALVPERFQGQTVTVRGRFRGRNLLGDLPAWPRRSQWDFVLQTADAAVWVAGKRPRGDGFDLATTSRAQTGRWLEVTGRFEIVDDLPVIVAEQLRTAEAVDDAEPAEAPPPPLPPATIVFSAPTPDEAEIARDIVVRLQFSRPILPASLEPNIKVRYADGVTEPVPKWTVVYRAGPIAAEIRFSTPLAPGVGVVVEVGAGVQSTDRVGVTPTTLRFTTVR
ncbi:MAG: Ig-like domain-containing protein [Vicinamibacterales bacterium]